MRKTSPKRHYFVSSNEKAKSKIIARLVQIARKDRLSYGDFLYICQQARRKLGLRRPKRERKLPQLLGEADLKRFFRVIQDCGDVGHEIMLKFLFFKEALVNELDDDEYYAILAAKSIRIQNRISPILKALTFLGEPSAHELYTAIDYFKSKDGIIDKGAPVGFLSSDERKAVTDGTKFRVSLYKALLFLYVQGAIKSGTLNLRHSYKYRPLDEYLIDRDRWHRDKAALIERAQLQAFVDPHRVLAELDEALSCQYGITNATIREGKNPYIKFKNTGFSLSTPTQEASEAEPLQNFFPERHYVPLLEVLATVNRYSRWMDELQHWQQRHHHDRPSEQTVYAGVIGIGCTIGIR